MYLCKGCGPTNRHKAKVALNGVKTTVKKEATAMIAKESAGFLPEILQLLIKISLSGMPILCGKVVIPANIVAARFRMLLAADRFNSWAI